MTTLTQKEAEAQGYRPFTLGYDLPKEQWMLDNVLRDLRHANITHVLVTTNEGIEVWKSL